jgi:hypothetical protein
LKDLEGYRRRERERNRSEKARRKGRIEGGDDRKWTAQIAVFRNLRVLLTASGLISSPRRLFSFFLACL